jgi:hypothetical protein
MTLIPLTRRRGHRGRAGLMSRASDIVRDRPHNGVVAITALQRLRGPDPISTRVARRKSQWHQSKGAFANAKLQRDLARVAEIVASGERLLHQTDATTTSCALAWSSTVGVRARTGRDRPTGGPSALALLSRWIAVARAGNKPQQRTFRGLPASAPCDRPLEDFDRRRLVPFLEGER